MKKIISSLLLIISIYSLQAQLPKHIQWQISSQVISDKEADIHFKAILDPTWHIWSQTPGDDMLIPPTFTIDKNSNITLVGKPKEIGKKITKKEEGFDNPLSMYEGTVDFVQKIQYKKSTDIKGVIEYQICDPQSCLPPTTYDFQIKLNAVGVNPSVDSTKVTKELNKVEAPAIPNSETVDTPDAIVAEENQLIKEDADSFGIYGVPLSSCNESKVEKLGVWTAFLAGIIGGFLALFFPCTFPMIPMTMSFFLKGSGDKKKGIQRAIFYGFSIFLVYFLMSLPFLFLGWSSDTLNDFSTNIWVNLTFFVIFIVFAFSLFGYYDISMPNSIANKIDSKSDIGGYFGIFFMALTLAIVSFSCTGPILGLVLGNLKNAKLIMPAMSGFGIGLGVPFALFAIFPNLLNSLPKSGSWLNVMKVTFGFIELAFAFKFLSNADLVSQWGLLKREPFVIIWMIVFLLLGLYLFGIFKFKKEDIIRKTKWTWLLGIASILFVGYLATDFIGGDLQYISGFPPPKSYSIQGVKDHFDTHKNEYESSLTLAKKENKLLLIDYTGWACVNCRKMEENVWIHPEIKDLMNQHFVITSLYVDEKTELPKDQQYFSKALDKQVITVGNKWTDMEVTNMHQVTQPLYAIIDPTTGRIVNKPVGGYMSVQDFKNFLNCAISYHKNNK